MTMKLMEGRVLLRDFETPDVDALLAVHSDPRVLHYYAPEVGTLPHAQMLVGMFIEWARENPRQNFQLAIVDLKTNAFLGSCGVRTRGCAPGQAEFGIGLASDWWGRGLAQEAAKMILRFGFSQLGLLEVRGVAVAENEAVGKFARRVGFTSGTPRRGDAWMTERNWSAVDWVITRETWERISADAERSLRHER